MNDRSYIFKILIMFDLQLANLDLGILNIFLAVISPERFDLKSWF